MLFRICSLIFLIVSYVWVKNKFGSISEMELQFSSNDPSSFATPDQAIVKSLHISWLVNFARHTLSGTVKLNVTKVVTDANELVLDVKDLSIFSVSDEDSGLDLSFKVSDKYKDIGSKMSIDISKCAPCSTILITYETSRTANGLQWLTPAQTSGKKHPYVFSVGQPTEMRSMMPCQDTPSVKASFTADIRAPAELVVLMGAKRKNEPIELQDGTRIHQFEQSVPVPSYLISLAAGALESRRIGPRSEVWCEKEIIDQCVHEFSETEEMLKTAENICGPYVWGIYDLLVLPPSFAYGGMEHPCLTFVTPSLLAGDRSLANVVAHEIAHSWTGNLVTNANFEHFWLNEGFTVFIERKILGRMFGTDIQDFNAIIGLQDLRDTITDLGEKHPFTKLVPELTGIHPDEAFSKVPYEKGQLFLRVLEQLVGGSDIFEKFLRAYLEKYQYKSIKTNDFENEFKKNFPNVDVDWNKWLHTPGLPPQLPKLDSSLLDKCVELKNQLLEYDTMKTSTAQLIFTNLTRLQNIQLTQLLGLLIEDRPLSIDTLESMATTFNFSKMNAEIKFRWIRLCIKSRWQKQLPFILDFINSTGRMRYLNPIYKELYDWKEIRSELTENYKKNKEFMQKVAQKAIERIIPS